ncbi:MAG: hypothetical protein PHI73_03505 [Patescibacteria group bacterium]|nr:hypothetical protein [Patescibacteria group bacterium]
MTVEDYLKSQKVNSSKTEPQTADREFLDKNGPEAFIYRCLMSKKFRKWKVGEDYVKELKESIHYAVTKHLPINTTYFFGGYKLWSFETSPEVDWAEFFNICYMLKYITLIVQAYEPGVIMTYWAAHPSIMKRQSNIPEKDCLIYRQSFNKLLGEFLEHLPGNIKLELRSFAELYPNEKEYLDELEPFIDKVKQEYKDWPEERKKKREATSNLNLQWQGAEDWKRLNENEKQEKIKMGPIAHDGYCRLSRVHEAIRGLGKVDLSATPLPKYNSIPIGTTSNSVAKFWTGFGVLEKRGDGYIDRILSPKQFEQIKNQDHEVVKSDLIPLKNFKEIWVYPGELSFS